MTTLIEVCNDFLPKSDFRNNFSNLIMSIWIRPELKQQIESEPSLLAEFGFTKIPQKIKFVDTIEISTLEGFELQINEYQQDNEGNAIFYLPPKPDIDHSNLLVASYCCCCCCCCD